MSNQFNVLDFPTLLAAQKNYFINGTFMFWQRGQTITAPANGQYGPDRWSVRVAGGGVVSSWTRQAFTAGQTDVAGNPEFFSRITIGTAGDIAIQQSIESVRTLATQRIAFSFWAKASAATTIDSAFLTQSFGTGGSPSATVNETIILNDYALTTSWKRFYGIITVPSIAGKTLGTAGNDRLTLRVDINETFTGSFDFANAQVEKGGTPTDFEFRPPGFEFFLCQRYFEKSYNPNAAPGSVTTTGVQSTQTADNPTLTGGTIRINRAFTTPKRTTPTVSYWDEAGNISRVTTISGNTKVDNVTPGATPVANPSTNSFLATSTNGPIRFHWTTDAEL